MTATTSDDATRIAAAGRRHPRCWVCAHDERDGLAVEFKAGNEGAVEAEFDCPERYEGYPGYIHGGMISTLLDGVMTQCLFDRGTPGLTAKLEVRYLKPVRVGRPARVSGWLLKSRGRLHDLESVLTQDGEVIVTARGRFMEFPGKEDSQDEGGER